jgi:hypothetical protein
LNYESLSKFILNNQIQITDLVFINIKGFEINYSDSVFNGLFTPLNQTLPIGINIAFIRTNLEFYSDKRLIKNCQDYIEEYKTHKYSLLQAVRNEKIRFEFSNYKTPICTLAFN